MSKARPERPPPPVPKPGIVKIFCVYVIYDHIILYSSPQTSYDRVSINKGNNKITELRTILQKESPNS